jgi:hypothetical protein
MVIPGASPANSPAALKLVSCSVLLQVGDTFIVTVIHRVKFKAQFPLTGRPGPLVRPAGSARAVIVTVVRHHSMIIMIEPES